MIEDRKSASNPEENQENISTSETLEVEDGTYIDPEVFIESKESASETSDEVTQTVGESVTDTDSENAEIIAALQQENANLKKQLDEAKLQSNGYKAQYARLAADFDNFRKRTAKETENLQQQAKKKIITELLPVVDNFERARVQIKPNSDGEKTIHNSYQGVYKTLVDWPQKTGSIGNASRRARIRS